MPSIRFVVTPDDMAPDDMAPEDMAETGETPADGPSVAFAATDGPSGVIDHQTLEQAIEQTPPTPFDHPMNQTIEEESPFSGLSRDTSPSGRRFPDDSGP